MSDNLLVEQWFNEAVKLTKDAGKMINVAFKKGKTVEFKSSSRDLVTETDKNVEKLLIDGLRSAFPDHEFIGEESVAAGAKCELTNAPTWIIDPVDGTMNFVHCLPYIAVSIALWVEKKPVLGIVYNPILDQLYSAKRGQGAYLNSERIHVSKQTELSKSLIMTEIGFRENPARMEVVMQNTQKIISKAHGFRALGSAALHICHVAAGGVDASLSLELFPWDKAAGVLLVTEAGGCVVDNAGGQHDVMKRRVICAATAELAQEMVSSLQYYDVE